MDELRTAISMYVDLPIGSTPSSSGKAGKVGKAAKGKGSPKKAAAPSSSSTESPAYDRWNLLDDATIDYGHVAKTGGGGIDKADNGYYITTAINYTNGPAHMGHAYEAATSDVIARFQRLKGSQPVYFVTGADEHGQKIANTAADKGKQPIEICNQVRFSDSWSASFLHARQAITGSYNKLSRHFLESFLTFSPVLRNVVAVIRQNST